MTNAINVLLNSEQERVPLTGTNCPNTCGSKKKVLILNVKSWKRLNNYTGFFFSFYIGCYLLMLRDAILVISGHYILHTASFDCRSNTNELS